MNCLYYILLNSFRNIYLALCKVIAILSIIVCIFYRGINLSSSTLFQEILHTYDVHYTNLYVVFSFNDGICIYLNNLQYKDIYCDYAVISLHNLGNSLKINRANIMVNANTLLSNNNKSISIDHLQIGQCNIEIIKDSATYYLYDVKLHVSDGNIILFNQQNEQLFYYDTESLVIHKNLYIHIPALMYAIEGRIDGLSTEQCNGHIHISDAQHICDINIHDNKVIIEYDKRQIEGIISHQNNRPSKLYIREFGIVKDDVCPRMYEHNKKLFQQYVQKLAIDDISINLKTFEVDLLFNISINHTIPLKNISGKFNFKDGTKFFIFQWNKVHGTCTWNRFITLHAHGPMNISHIIKNKDIDFIKDKVDIDLKINDRSYSGIKDIALDIECKNNHISNKYINIKNVNGKIQYKNFGGKISHFGTLSGQCNNTDTTFTINDNSIKITNRNYPSDILKNIGISCGKYLQSTYNGILHDHYTIGGTLDIYSDDFHATISHNQYKLNIQTPIINGTLQLKNWKIYKCNLNHNSGINLLLKGNKIYITGAIRESKHTTFQPLHIQAIPSPFIPGIYNTMIDVSYKNHKLNGYATLLCKKNIVIQALKCRGSLCSIEKINQKYHIHTDKLSVLDPGIIEGNCSIICSIKKNSIIGNISMEHVALKKPSSGWKNMMYKVLLLFISPKLSIQSLLGKKFTFSHSKSEFIYKYPTLTLKNASIYDVYASLKADGYINLLSKQVNLHCNLSPFYLLNKMVKLLPVFNMFGKRDTIINKSFDISGSLDEPTIQVFKEKIFSNRFQKK